VFISVKYKEEKVSEAVISVTDTNFKKEILKSSLPAMVDFWAEWCMPCKMISPVVHEIARENKGKLKVAKINVDSDPELATQMSVMNIPTVIFFKNGREYKRMVGINTKRSYEKIVKELVKGV